jgi:hypothetical protein
MRWPIRVLLAATLLACACGGGSTGGSRDGGTDAVASFTMPDLPPGCPPSVGNDIGVGAPCTRTGNECTGGLQCSCKDWFGYAMPAGMPCLCTSVTFGSACSACGNSAQCCPYSIPLPSTDALITIGACFPDVCAPGGKCPSIQ